MVEQCPWKFIALNYGCQRHLTSSPMRHVATATYSYYRIMTALFKILHSLAHGGIETAHLLKGYFNLNCIQPVFQHG